MIDLKKNYLVGFVGQSRSGKTHLIRAFINGNHENFTHIYVFSTTRWKTNKESLEKTTIIDEFDESSLVVFFDFLCEQKKKGKFRPLVVFDDFMSAIKKQKHKIWTDIATRGRHCAFWIFSCQYLTNGIPSFVRKQFHYYFAMVSGLSRPDVENLTQYIGLQSKYRGNPALLERDMMKICNIEYSFMCVITIYDRNKKGLYFLDAIKNGAFELVEIRL